MIPELGLIALLLALLCAVLPLAVFVGRAPLAVITMATRLQFGLICGAFVALTLCFLWSDFSVRVVVDNSHTLKPLLYKIGGVWGNHEGSMLLWVLVLTFFATLVSFSKTIQTDLKSATLSVQSFITSLFLMFLIFTSNPFARLEVPAIEGNDLNPLLQDPGLIFHPPLLYIGYVGFSLVFSFALAGLLLKKIDKDWARTIKPWSMLAWSALTAGIALGSWWAYYELGWGGFWFWDPVENASLMPWLLGTALLHSIAVLEKRGAFLRWTVLLALLAFAFSILGTFLVRSGILTSVHAFALDPDRGSLLLLMMLGLLGFALFLLTRDWDRYAAPVRLNLISRETMLLLNNLFLCTITATIFIGTLYPIFLSALDAGAVAVGPPYFHATVFPLAAPMFALMGLAALIPWKTGNLKDLQKPITLLVAITLTVVIALGVINTRGPWLALPAFGFALWVLGGAIIAFLRATKTFGSAFYVPLSYWAMTLAHISVAVAIIGMVGVGLWKVETVAVMKTQDKIEVGSHTLTLHKIGDVFGPNYIAARAEFTLEDGTKVQPEKRHYPAANMGTTEADILLNLKGDLYVTLGEAQPDLQGWAVTAWVHPLAGVLWIGFIGLFISGLLSTLSAFRKNNYEY